MLDPYQTETLAESRKLAADNGLESMLQLLQGLDLGIVKYWKVYHLSVSVSKWF